jgi:hypothetical protein
VADAPEREKRDPVLHRALHNVEDPNEVGCQGAEERLRPLYDVCSGVCRPDPCGLPHRRSISANPLQLQLALRVGLTRRVVHEGPVIGYGKEEAESHQQSSDGESVQEGSKEEH